ncbi:MAG TPA: phenylalanine--tRNA ligase subunit alpha, partial [Solirubrobacterales bacterium]|nr:phenylalanine--tRNA ligase subunit alpha [Solirubrobacterales bacterium]
MVERIEEINTEAEEAIAAAASTDELEQLRVRFLGRKAELPNILRGVSDLSADERAAVGKAGNEAKVRIEHMLGRKREELDASELGARLAEDAIDVTLPGSPLVPVGAQNPLIRTQREIEDIFIGLGYRVMEGPEVELDYYNFTALNHPPGHPARMAQDTFYVDPSTLRADLRIPADGDALPPGPEDVVLRTHTSPMQ